MIAEAMRHPGQIRVGDRIASYWTPQNVQKVLEVTECDGKHQGCFAPSLHVMTDQGETRFSQSGFTNGYAWSKIR